MVTGDKVLTLLLYIDQVSHLFAMLSVDIVFDNLTQQRYGF